MALTKKQREKLRMKFGGRCAYCGCELPEKAGMPTMFRRCSASQSSA